MPRHVSVMRFCPLMCLLSGTGSIRYIILTVPSRRPSGTGTTCRTLYCTSTVGNTA